MTSVSSMGNKFRLIRKAEKMTRQEFADCVGLSYDTITNYETRGTQVTESALMKVAKNPRFKKYAYWLSTDETMPEVGQISPALSLDGSEKPEDVPDLTHKTAKSHR
ncbi:XRE family transcriptional regulator [Salmonella enterica]|uniref:XRE family transcriptional regulator n=2 Tax=Salmonella enterica TaxID=28901 RepID=A0A5X9IJT1_SALET|nr:helix-turn-helix transcriptional regulator [Salmonella enterica]EAA6773631.1 XRE family transcriptional regulator [Salmonella enterica subsp. enterica serovar Agona]EBF6576864.1 helix-turn-helix transcriptional regulator [Salmonella enterica subsp. enterica serovar Typhimurium]EBH8227059.1 XRE family transcriptional regulator [Salmonella enterica subsp. enterica serovar Typhimurium str. UK-1]EBM6563618.1 XRE family transcriptional regulator [Salmonella enterica subsp. enterica serovar Poona]